MRRCLWTGVITAVALVCGQGEVRAQPPPSLEVVVDGVRGEEGVVTVSLCTRDEYARDDCRLMRSTPATPPRSVVTFSSFAPGRYAVEVFHDRDRDGEVARGLFGVPAEGVGFSRNPALWRRPSFEDVAIDLEAGPRRLTVSLKFEPAAHKRAR